MALDFFSRTKSISVAEQAAEWLVEFEDGALSDAQRRAFVAWLKRSPVHIEEFLQLSAIHAQLGTAPALQDALEDILAEADGTVVALEPPSAGAAVEAGVQGAFKALDARMRGREEKAAVRSRPRRRLALAAAALVLVTGSLAVSTLLLDRGEQVYRTGFGEQRSIPLEDGTVLTLNTSSEVRVSLGEQLRQAKLIAGEVMFDVAKDANRPFRVSAGPMAIQVVGTRFNVYRQDEQTTLTVLEGKVDVAPAAAVEKPELRRRVEAGGQLVVAATGELVQPPPADVERVAAWTARRVIFDNEPLANVLAEFNRYNSRQLIVDDAALAQRRVSGVFKVHDVDVLIAFLQQQHDLQIDRDGTELKIAPIR